MVEEIQQEANKPMEHTKLYDKYSFLINREADKEVEAFLQQEHSFDDYAREVRKYHNLVDQIRYNSVKVCTASRLDLIKLCSSQLDDFMSKSDICIACPWCKPRKGKSRHFVTFYL